MLDERREMAFSHDVTLRTPSLFSSEKRTDKKSASLDSRLAAREIELEERSRGLSGDRLTSDDTLPRLRVLTILISGCESRFAFKIQLASGPFDALASGPSSGRDIDASRSARLFVNSRSSSPRGISPEGDAQSEDTPFQPAASFACTQRYGDLQTAAMRSAGGTSIVFALLSFPGILPSEST